MEISGVSSAEADAFGECLKRFELVHDMWPLKAK